MRGRNWGWRWYGGAFHVGSGLRGIALTQKTACNPQRSLRLFHIDRLGQYKVRAYAKRFCNARLTFHDCHGQRGLIGCRLARAFEQQHRVLLAVAVHDDAIEMFAHEFLDRCKRLATGLNCKLQVIENQRHRLGSFFVRAE